eukprot:1192054-Prorocentrum_minimum.AAC.2
MNKQLTGLYYHRPIDSSYLGPRSCRRTAAQSRTEQNREEDSWAKESEKVTAAPLGVLTSEPLLPAVAARSIDEGVGGGALDPLVDPLVGVEAAVAAPVGVTSLVFASGPQQALHHALPDGHEELERHLGVVLLPIGDSQRSDSQRSDSQQPAGGTPHQRTAHLHLLSAGWLVDYTYLLHLSLIAHLHLLEVVVGEDPELGVGDGHHVRGA